MTANTYVSVLPIFKQIKKHNLNILIYLWINDINDYKTIYSPVYATFISYTYFLLNFLILATSTEPHIVEKFNIATPDETLVITSLCANVK